jgi:hypothetical protein
MFALAPPGIRASRLSLLLLPCFPAHITLLCTEHVLVHATPRRRVPAPPAVYCCSPGSSLSQEGHPLAALLDIEAGTSVNSSPVLQLASCLVPWMPRNGISHSAEILLRFCYGPSGHSLASTLVAGRRNPNCGHDVAEPTDLLGTRYYYTGPIACVFV